MASNGKVNNFNAYISISVFLCLFSLLLQASQAQDQLGQPQPQPQTQSDLEPTITIINNKRVRKYPPGGRWEMLHPNIGVSAMHMQLLHDDTVVVFDRTDTGVTNLTLPPGKPCHKPANVVDHDSCSAHSLLFDLKTRTYRALYVNTDTWCSSGAVLPDGTLIQTGGFKHGEKKIREFKPCKPHELCDWIELPTELGARRWYATNHILPDGRIIIVGGEASFNYEFFPKDANPANHKVYDLPLLRETKGDDENYNLYPAVHLLPDGNVFILANRRSILLDYIHDKVVKEFPQIPGEIRSYPCTGTSAILPLKLNKDQRIQPEVEVMVCGGAKKEALFLARNRTIFIDASKNCGRLRVSDPNPQWFMEDMPMPRVMPDMINLPDGNILIINGASKGTAGWEWGDDAIYTPVLYKPDEKDLTKRFVVMNPSKIPRMYHSTALLLPDGRVLVAGSNPYQHNIFQGKKYLTDMTMETFYPEYLLKKGHQKPFITSVSAKDNIVKYGDKFEINIELNTYRADDFKVVLIYPSFTTHSVQMNQRLIVLPVDGVKPIGPNAYQVMVDAPLSPTVAPPGFYMMFVVNGGIPSHSVWINIARAF